MKTKSAGAIFALCWSAYALAYFGRVNISVAIPSIQEELGWSRACLGMVGSCFFWVYAIGQLINGIMGDRVNSRWFIFSGLAISGVLNFSFGLTKYLWPMVIIWSLNGYFQSMLWGPIMGTISRWSRPARNNLIAVGMAGSTTVGYILAWGLSGKIVASMGWRGAFWLPGIILLFFSVFWVVRIPDSVVKSRKNFIPDSGLAQTESFLKMTSSDGLWLVVLVCVAQGVVKEGINLWGPLLLKETMNLNLGEVIGYAVLIPVTSFIGAVFAGWLNRLFNYREKLVVDIFMTGSLVAVVVFRFFGCLSITVGAASLAITSGFISGTNSMLMSMIPLKFARKGRVSSVAGLLDFSSYIGAGLSGVLTGLISDMSGWGGVIDVWMIAILVGVVAISFAEFLEIKKVRLGVLDNE